MENKTNDIRTIGSTEVETKERQKLNDEELKKLAHDAARHTIILGLKTQLQQIKSEMLRRNLTIEDIVSEVENKTSNLSASARKVITDFKPDAVSGYLNDFEKVVNDYKNKLKQTAKNKK